MKNEEWVPKRPVRRFHQGNDRWILENYGEIMQTMFLHNQVLAHTGIPYFAKQYRFNNGNAICIVMDDGIDSIITSAGNEMERREEYLTETEYECVVINAVKSLGKIFFTHEDPKKNIYIDLSSIPGANGRWVPVIATLDYYCHAGVFAYYVYPGMGDFGYIRIVKFLIDKPMSERAVYKGRVYQRCSYQYVIVNTLSLDPRYYGYSYVYNYWDNLVNLMNNNYYIEYFGVHPQGWRFPNNNTIGENEILGVGGAYSPKIGIVWIDPKKSGNHIFDKLQFRIYARIAGYCYSRAVSHQNNAWVYDIWVPTQEWLYTDGVLDNLAGWKYIPVYKKFEIVFGQGGLNSGNGHPSGFFLEYPEEPAYDFWAVIRGVDWVKQSAFHFEYVRSSSGCFPLLTPTLNNVQGHLFLYQTLSYNFLQWRSQTVLSRTIAHYTHIIDWNNNTGGNIRWTESPIYSNTWYGSDESAYGSMVGMLLPPNIIGGGTLAEASAVDLSHAYRYSEPKSLNNNYYEIKVRFNTPNNFGMRGGVYVGNYGEFYVGRNVNIVHHNNHFYQNIVLRGARKLYLPRTKKGNNFLYRYNSSNALNHIWYVYGPTPWAHRYHTYSPNANLSIFWDGIRVDKNKIINIGESGMDLTYRWNNIGEMSKYPYSVSTTFGAMPKTIVKEEGKEWP